MSCYSKGGANCSVYGCPNYKQQRESKSFFRMPKDPNLLKTWVAACKSERLDLFMKSKDPEYFYKYCVVCSDHFQLSCFRNKNQFSQGLIRGSIPTLKVFNASTPIIEEISDKTQEVKIEKIWLDEQPNEEIAAAVVSDESTFPACTSSKTLLPLEDENIRLKAKIKEYRKKLKLKSSLLWKYKERNRLLQEKLKKKVVRKPDKNVADHKINFLRINLADWD